MLTVETSTPCQRLPDESHPIAASARFTGIKDSTLRKAIADQLAAALLRHRFVVIFDREGSHHSLLSQLREHQLGTITYQKNVTDTRPETEFTPT